MILSNKKLKLIIVCLLLLIFSYFIGIFNVKAQVVDTTTTIGQGRVHGSFTSNYTLGNNVFYNQGQGKIIYQFLATGQMNINSISLEYHQSSKTNSICQFGTVSNYNDSANQQVFYSIVCDVDLTNAGIDNLIIKGYAWQTSTIDFSGYLQFSNFENGNDYTQVLNNVDANLNSISSAVWFTKNNTDAIKQYIESIVNNNSNINNNVSDIKDSLTDSNVDDSSSSTSGFDSTTNSGMTNTPVSNLIALPITFLSGVNNAISSSCTNVNYIELFSYQLVLPCLNLSQRLGEVWTIIDTIFCCMLIFNIGKSLVRTFARLSDMDTNIMYECYANGKSHRGDGD